MTDMSGSVTPAKAMVRTGEVLLALDDWGGDGTPILFLHATGFSRSVWRPMCRTFLARHPGYRMLSLDMRGHGESSKPPAPYLWSHFVTDLEAVSAELHLRDLILCGHSVGGSTAVSFAVKRPELTAALVLVEGALSGARPTRQPSGIDLVERTNRRRWQWRDRAEAGEYLRARSPYDSWDPAVFASWLETGLRDVDEGVELSCPPWVEASVFVEASDSRAWEELEDLRCPVWVGRGTGMRGLPSTTSPGAAKRIPHAVERVSDGDGHFVPLERVDWTVGLIEEAVAFLETGKAARGASHEKSGT